MITDLAGEAGPQRGDLVLRVDQLSDRVAGEDFTVFSRLGAAGVGRTNRGTPRVVSSWCRSLEAAGWVMCRDCERLAAAGIEPSVGSISNSYDNALAETINGLFKAEVIHRRGPWRNAEAVEFATLEWVDWFKHGPLLAPIGNIPPAEAEARTMRKPKGSLRAA